MAIELAMVRFIGAGVSMWATGLGLSVPSGAISDGSRLIYNLTGTHRETTTDILSDMKSRILSQVRQTDVSQQEVESCLAVLPELLDNLRLDPDLLHSAVVQAEVEQFSDGDISEIARHLSSELSALMRNSSYSQDPRLQSPLAFVLMEWLFECLLLNHESIVALKPAIARCLLSFDDASGAKTIQKGKLGRQKRSNNELSDGAVAQSELGVENSDEQNCDSGKEGLREFQDLISRVIEGTGLSELAIAGLIRAGYGENCNLTELKQQARSCRALIEQLHGVGATIGMDKDLCEALEGTADALACGDFSDAGERLKRAELMAASKLPRSNDCREKLSLEKTYEYLALKTLRAKYHEILMSWREAAVLYQSACSLLPDTARYERWRLMTKCAEALGKFGKTQNNTDALIEATRVYAEAGGLLLEQDDPREWAGVHLDIGKVLMLLGKREGRPARFLAAALHFKPAADVLVRISSHKDWAKAQLLLAQALKAQGEVQGDVVTLGDAVSCYRKAMGVISRDSDLEAWAETQCGLGATLQRIGEETDDSSELETAMQALQSVLKYSSDISSQVVAEAEAAMARAKIQLAFERSDIGQLQSAIALLNNARKAMARDVSTSDLAEIECNLGLAIWSLAQSDGHEGTDLALAVEAFQSAAMRYEAQGDEMNVQAVRERIAELNALIAPESVPAA
ncbi:MAG: hypothetical protein ACRBCJ_08950 [Hyphomicrobiaceae bacterium]